MSQLDPANPARTARLRWLTALLALAFCSLALASPAWGSPAWSLHAFATPSSFTAADNAECLNHLHEDKKTKVVCDAYRVTATDAGAAPTDGSPITLEQALPAGVTVQQVSLYWSGTPRFEEKTFGLVGPETDIAAFGLCSTGATVKCEFPGTGLFNLILNFLGLNSVQPDGTLEMIVYVTVDDPKASETVSASASVSGGGAPSAATAIVHNGLGEPAPAFGVSGFGFDLTGPDGRPYTQAAGHAYEQTTRLDLTNEFRIPPDTSGAIRDTSIRDVKDVVVDLPLGLLGNAQATPRCTFAQLTSHIGADEGGCPPETVIGHIATQLGETDTVNGPVYNMAPERGSAGEFAFVDSIAGVHVLYARVVPGPSGYVLQVTAPDIPQVSLMDVVTTFYGDPAARDAAAVCGSGAEQRELACREALSGSAQAFFTNPADCSAPPHAASVHIDSWQAPGALNPDGTPDLSDPRWVSASSEPPLPSLTGCNLLQFDPVMSAQPETTVADSPTGLTFDLKLPQAEAPETLATPPLRRAEVTLPPGFTVDPSSAGGLGACAPAQIALSSAAEPSCPGSSKIGTVQLTTPLLPGVLQGSVYLAAPYQNPFHSLLAGYIVVDDPATGVVVKIPGEIQADAATGQIKGVFDNNPQFPFSELKLHFKGGSRGALATPESCGAFTTTSALSPWSAPDSGPAATPADSLTIDSGCVSGFAPSFAAGTTSNHAGAYAPFVMSFSRADGDQELGGLRVSLPPGLLAKVAGVPLCPDAALAAAAARSGSEEQAASSCPVGSQIGTVQAGAGPGPTPFFVGGKAYLAGPYRGAPYSLAVVVPALAGPFDLGNVVVRSALQIDPSDGHVTAISDPFPTILKGIALRVRRIDVTLDRPSFTFNPTSCEPMSIAGALSSTGGLSAPVSARFQAAGCGELPFKPRLSAHTQGRTSKADGASLTVEVSQSPGEAAIRKVDLQLPLALPSRLTTLQKACTEAQFNADPAACPSASNIGTATAVTPLLNVPLTGPAYLVSHGSAAFPDVEFVLQGEGVRIVLDGKTDIKNGITYSRFETVPDAPIASFRASFPEGPHSVLAANGSLCRHAKSTTVRRRVAVRVHGRIRHVLRSVRRTVPAPLQMPTSIAGQNGALLRQTTRIAVIGCPARATRGRHRRRT